MACVFAYVASAFRRIGSREKIASDVVRTFRSARHGRPKGLHYSDFFTASKAGSHVRYFFVYDTSAVAIRTSSGKQIAALVADLASASAITRDGAVARLTVIGSRA